MTTDDGFVKPAPVQADRLIWGYDGDQFDPRRRVSVLPWSMLTDLIHVSHEAQGLLMLIFLRYWAKDRPVRTVVAQRTHRLSVPRFKRLMGELIDAGVVVQKGDLLMPAGAFGVDPDADSRVPRTRAEYRNMPSEWADLREAVFARDGYSCVYCGSGHDLHCDHVHPLARGGTHDIGNLVAACAACNLSKGSKTVAEWRPDIAEAMRR